MRPVVVTIGESELSGGGCCDGLTALVTRDVVAAVLERPHAAPVTLVAVDLDGFRWVNDELGDDVGDAVLCATARRLERLAASHRPTSGRLPSEALTVARLGDDEFGVVLSGDPVDVAHFVDRVLGAFRSPLVVELAAIPLTVSVGIAASAAPEGASGRRIVQWASRAARIARRRGGDRAVVYSLDMSPSHRAQLAAEHLLRGR
ncbi:MAG: GGDEF domain-containing protein [Actinomycetota bacterium]